MIDKRSVAMGLGEKEGVLLGVLGLGQIKRKNEMKREGDDEYIGEDGIMAL